MPVLRLVGGQDFKVKAPELVSSPPKLVVPSAMPGDLADDDTLRRHLMAQQIEGVSVRALIDEICECSQPYSQGTPALRRSIAIQLLLSKVGIAAMLAPDGYELDAPVCATVIEPLKILKAFPGLAKWPTELLGLALY